MAVRIQRVVRLVFLVTGIVFVFFVYNATWPASKWFDCDDNFAVTLERHASPDRFIILALVDTSFVDMAINLYQSSLRPNGIRNFLFVGAGKRACDIISNFTLPCFYYTEDKSTDVASTFRSPDFIRKMNIRTDMILEALELGFTVLHTDLDVMFIRNPIPEIKVTLLTADIAALWDSAAYNAGFIIVRPTIFSRKIYERMKFITQSSAKTDDQRALNIAINEMNRLYKKDGFTAVALDRSRYLCGVDYFEKGKRLFPGSCADCMVVHNNWIVGREAKVYRFKEHGMWLYDKEGYYSSIASHYLTYENPVIWDDDSSGVAEELEALKAALAYGELLNRVVILPRFHCFDGGIYNRSKVGRGSHKATGKKATETPTGTMKPIRDRECPLNSFLRITAFDAVFAGRYRESSFLQHPLVPKAIKHGLSPNYLVITNQNVDLIRSMWPTTAGIQKIMTTSVSGAVGMNKTLRKLTSDYKVLRFESLYRAIPRFPEKSKQEQFQMKIKSAFRIGTYRQF